MLINKTHDAVNVTLSGVNSIFNVFKVDESIPSPMPDPTVDRSPLTGVIDASQPLILDGYTVAFLQQPLSPSRAKYVDQTNPSLIHHS
jgi:hypothetical protein